MAKEKFRIGGEEFTIIETIDSNDINIHPHRHYEIKITSRIYRRTIFPIIPVVIMKHFCWLNKYVVTSRLQFKRIVKFNDNLSFENPWLRWRRSWVDEKLEIFS